MAVVELQFRERSFLELVGSEALRPPLAPRVLDEVRRRNGDGRPARLRLVSAEWARPHLRARAPGPGAVLVKVTLAVDLPGAPARRSVVTRSLTAELWIEVGVGAGGPTYRLAELQVVAPVAHLPAAAAPLLLGGERTGVHHGAVAAAGGVVSVRLATTADDDVTGPVEDRLEGHDWTRLVPGAVLAEALSDALDDAVDAVTREPQPELRAAGPTAGGWRARSPATGPTGRSGGGGVRAGTARPAGGLDPEAAGADEPVASAAVPLVAVGALPFAFDLPFTLAAEARFRIARSAVAAPPVLAGTTVVRVRAADPEALAAFGPLDLLADELRAGLDRRLDSTPAGAVARDHGPAALVVDTRRSLTLPATRAWAGLLASARVDEAGLVVAGMLVLRQPGEVDLRDRRGHEWVGLRVARRRAEPDDTLTVP